MGPVVPISVTLGRVDPPTFICLISKTRIATPASWWPVRISTFIKQENGKVPALSRSSQRERLPPSMSAARAASLCWEWGEGEGEEAD